jgi:hypothetical protein
MLVRAILSALKEVARLLNRMLSSGVITNYALFGAVAQMRYTEAVATMDADVLVATPSGSGLGVLRPIYEYCAAQGYGSEGEAIRVGEWPVQFIPAFNPLTEEAMREAQTGEIEGEPVRVVRADYLGVIALSTGRPKDYARILALLDSGVVSIGQLERLAALHGLAGKWRHFYGKFLE